MKKKSYIISLLVLTSLILSACSIAPSAILSKSSANILRQAANNIEEQASALTLEDASEEPVQALEQSTNAPSVQAPTDPSLLAAYENALTNVYEKVNPSVVFVSVKVQGTTQLDFEGMPDLPFDFPGNPSFPESPDQPSTPQFGYGTGSGFVWDQEGHIITNNHVVDGAVDIEVNFSDGTSAPAELVGTDPYSDLAVIKVDVPADDLRPIELADSRDIKVGELAIAIGNPFGLDGTMTVGIISALGRSLPVSQGLSAGPTFSIPDVIQTDAPINPGNSGGVLVDDQGMLIGVPTAIESPVRANAGIGFAVPSSTVQRVVPVLISNGGYKHAYLGISGTSLNSDLAEAMGLDPKQRGALVTEVVPNGPADDAGLRGSDRQVEIDGSQMMVGGDVIIAADSETINDMDDLIAYLTGHTTVGQEINLTVLRDREQLQIDVTLSARPGSTEKAPQAQQPQTPGKARLGIVGGTLTPDVAEAMGLSSEQTGVLVDQVQTDGPADKAGIRGSYKPFEIDGQQILIGGDIIVAVEGQNVEAIDKLVSILTQYEPNDKVTLRVLRDGQQIEVVVKLGQMNE